MYDFLIVGSGISACAFSAILKHKYKIGVIDVRNHIGGNCYDYKINNTIIQKYGPHFFHTKNKEVVEFLSRFTEWISYNHSVTAEIDFNGNMILSPFPYSKETEKILGKSLSDSEIIDLFFKQYSKKMWNVEWNLLPEYIKNRVPKSQQEKSIYFPEQFVAVPKLGYSKMLENMLDGVDIKLNCEPNEWRKIKSHNIIYCGRLDKILENCHELSWRNLKFDLKFEHWNSSTSVVNFCHSKTDFTRKTNFNKIPNNLENKDENFIMYETPTNLFEDAHNPFYPFRNKENTDYYDELKEKISLIYPNMTLLGRTATYKYLDMDAAVALAINQAKKYL